MTFSSTFPLSPLGIVVDFINGDRSSNYPKGEDYVDVGIPFISATDLDNGRVDRLNARQISSASYERLRSGKIRASDVLFCLRGSLGKMAYVHGNELGAIASSLVILRSKGNIDPRYLYHALSSNDGQQAVITLNNGAAQPNLSVAELTRVEIPLPKLAIQGRIADILSAYDELIENSRKRINILESMARVLYSEWFVNFRFPGHDFVPLVASALGDIPQGWEVKRIAEAFQTVLGGTPSRTNMEFWEGGSIPWINSGKVNDLRITEASEMITSRALERSAAKLMPKGTTVLAITGATLGQVSYLEIETTANQSVIGIVDPTGELSEWVYLMIRDRIESIVNHASGGAQQHINKDNVNNVQVVIPSRSLALEFKTVVSPMFGEIATLLFQIQTLRRIRDLLLPRLLAGQIDIAAIAL